MCGSRKYPYPHHLRLFSLHPPPLHHSGISHPEGFFMAPSTLHQEFPIFLNKEFCTPWNKTNGLQHVIALDETTAICYLSLLFTPFYARYKIVHLSHSCHLIWNFFRCSSKSVWKCVFVSKLFYVFFIKLKLNSSHEPFIWGKLSLCTNNFNVAVNKNHNLQHSNPFYM